MDFVARELQAQEKERIRQSDAAYLQRWRHREQRLKPVYEFAFFTGLSGDMPINQPLSIESSIANFKSDKGDFSLVIDNYDVKKLSQGQNYMVGFVPMMMDEHISPVSITFFINALRRQSPVFGVFVSACRSEDIPVPSRNPRILDAPNGGTTPSPRG